MPVDRLEAAVADPDDLILGPADTHDAELAFDHDAIVAFVREQLRGKLAYSPIALALLPDIFTLRDRQTVHEAILAPRPNKPAFRRRMLDSG